MEQPPPEIPTHGGMAPPERPVTSEVDGIKTTDAPRTVAKETKTSPPTRQLQTTASSTTASESTTRSDQNDQKTSEKQNTLVDKIYNIFNKIVGINARPTLKTNPTTEPRFDTTTSTAAATTTKMEELTTTEATTTATKTTTSPQTYETTTAEKTKSSTETDASSKKIDKTESSEGFAQQLLNSETTTVTTTATTKTYVTTTAMPVTDRYTQTTKENADSLQYKTTTEGSWPINKMTTENVDRITPEQISIDTTTKNSESSQKTSTENIEQLKWKTTTQRPLPTQETTTENVDQLVWRTTTKQPLPTQRTTTENVDQLAWRTTTEEPLPTQRTTTENVDESVSRTTTEPPLPTQKTTTENLGQVTLSKTTEQPEPTKRTTTEDSNRPLWQTTRESREQGKQASTTEKPKQQQSEEEKDVDRIIASVMDMTTTSSPPLSTTTAPYFQVTRERTTETTPSNNYKTQSTSTEKSDYEQQDEKSTTTAATETQSSTTERPTTSQKKTTTEEIEWKVQDIFTTKKPEYEEKTKARPSTRVDRITWENEYETTTTEKPQTTAASSNEGQLITYATNNVKTTQTPQIVFTASNETKTDAGTENEKTEQTTTRKDVYTTENESVYTESLKTSSNAPVVKTNKLQEKIQAITTNPEQRTTHDYRQTGSRTRSLPGTTKPGKPVSPTTKPITSSNLQPASRSPTEEIQDFSARPFGFNLQPVENVNATDVKQTPTQTATEMLKNQSSVTQQLLKTGEPMITKANTEKPGIVMTDSLTYKSEAIPEKPSSDDNGEGNRVLSKEKPYEGAQALPSAYEKQSKDINKPTTQSTATTTIPGLTEIAYGGENAVRPTNNGGQKELSRNVTGPTEKASGGSTPGSGTQYQGGSVPPGNSYMSQYLLGIQKWYNKYVKGIENENMTFYPATMVKQADYDALKEEIKVNFSATF